MSEGCWITQIPFNRFCLSVYIKTSVALHTFNRQSVTAFIGSFWVNFVSKSWWKMLSSNTSTHVGFTIIIGLSVRCQSTLCCQIVYKHLRMNAFPFQVSGVKSYRHPCPCINIYFFSMLFRYPLWFPLISPKPTMPIKVLEFGQAVRRVKTSGGLLRCLKYTYSCVYFNPTFRTMLTEAIPFCHHSITSTPPAAEQTHVATTFAWPRSCGDLMIRSVAKLSISLLLFRLFYSNVSSRDGVSLLMMHVL